MEEDCELEDDILKCVCVCVICWYKVGELEVDELLEVVTVVGL